MSYVMAEDQPPEVQWVTVDGIFIKQMLIAKAGSFVPQHSHAYDHTSMLATGGVRLWAGEKLIGEFLAPFPIEIKAGIKHRFETLEDNTLIYCIHNFTHPDAVRVLEEHQLEGVV